MDLLAGCRAFLAVATHGGFTAGAAAVRIPQSVASRRVAALEAHLGGRLLERTSRSVRLTSLGADVLPSVRRLVELADALPLEADRSRRRPVRCAVPDSAGLFDLVALRRATDGVLDPVPMSTRRRVAAVRDRELAAALVPVPVDEADWTVDLGVVSRAGTGAFRPDLLRRGRRRSESLRHWWIGPEDDVAHVRDVIVRGGHAAGLLPTQVVVADDLVEALVAVTGGDDVLLASPAEARRWNLTWRAIAGGGPRRGYQVLARRPELAARLRQEFSAPLTELLGVGT